MAEVTDKSLKALEERVHKLATNMEKMKLAEYVRLLESPWRLLYVNFISGVARGLGIGVGFAVLSAVIIYILKSMVTIPVIGSVIAQIVEIVQIRLGTY
ncbi:hypothetical protein JOC37_001513 [Desulfohalotomaculum tongense]|uniref:DUF5665 domain-containing protein n=1 Tax=Desulforadius tongensis TaxID=1216062 RepID=UPI001959A856|nr:DUF5665 domain-containing protein [Desulforadius tongensis]MBM7855128.1 hypothetical protein [Desulforadius tongensis]